jgi:hypothetical protein
MWLYSRFYIPVARAPNWANSEAGDFHVNLAFSFLDNTQRPITIYTRARVSLLSSCSLEHGPSITVEKRAVKTQFLRCLWPVPGRDGFKLFLRQKQLFFVVCVIISSTPIYETDQTSHLNAILPCVSNPAVIMTHISPLG